ncbi:ECF-type sigma factor [Ferrimonas marina]|nr:ECF-type sigma factor [Ferrimonas marina]
MLPVLYQALRQRARSVKQRLPQCHTLDSRALIHEMYAKLADKPHQYVDEQHFLASASTAMRHVLIDYLRQKKANKRDASGLGIDQWFPEEKLEQLAEIDHALNRFEHRYPREHQVAVHRIFGGMTVPETASVLGVSPATVKRDWAFAQAWLHKSISRSR